MENKQNGFSVIEMMVSQSLMISFVIYKNRIFAKSVANI